MRIAVALACVLVVEACGGRLSHTPTAADAGDVEASTGDGLTTLASGLDHPWQLVVDATNVYWTNSASRATAASGSVMSCAKSGCSEPTVLASNQASPWAIAIGAGILYWSNRGSGTLMSCSANGCGAAPMIFLANLGNNVPYELVVDETNAYWSTGGGEAGIEIMVCPLTGCANTRTTLLWERASSELAVAENTLFSGSYDSVDACPITGCAMRPTELVVATSQPRSITVDAASVYWVSDADGTVMKCPLAGCKQPTIVASGQNEPTLLAVDGTSVYWANPADGTILKCAAAGCDGNPTVLASNQSPRDIVIDDTSVYWTNDPLEGLGSIVKLTPK